jgi:hypothetical protein
MVCGVMCSIYHHQHHVAVWNVVCGCVVFRFGANTGGWMDNIILSRARVLCEHCDERLWTPICMTVTSSHIHSCGTDKATRREIDAEVAMDEAERFLVGIRVGSYTTQMLIKPRGTVTTHRSINSLTCINNYVKTPEGTQ